jgi:hypothetical protein
MLHSTAMRQSRQCPLLIPLTFIFVTSTTAHEEKLVVKSQICSSTENGQWLQYYSRFGQLSFHNFQNSPNCKVSYMAYGWLGGGYTNPQSL